MAVEDERSVLHVFEHVVIPAGSTAELEWELEIQGHKDGMMTLSAMVAWPTGRNWVRADRFGERRKAFSRCLCRGGNIEAGTRKQ